MPNPKNTPCSCHDPATGPGKRTSPLTPPSSPATSPASAASKAKSAASTIWSNKTATAHILAQLSAVHEALRAVGRELLRNHLKHCATAAIQAGPKTAEPMYDELVNLMYKNAR